MAVLDSVRAAVEVAREAFRKERLTPGGVVNIVVMILLFLLLVASRIVDLAERLLDAQSSTPTIWLAVFFAAVGLVCLIIVGLFYERVLRIEGRPEERSR